MCPQSMRLFLTTGVGACLIIGKEENDIFIGRVSAGKQLEHPGY